MKKVKIGKGKNEIKVNHNDLKNVLEKLSPTNVTISDKIKEYLEIPGIGQAIVDGCELILRLRMQQYDTASGILMHHIKSKSKNINIFRNKFIADALQSLKYVTKLEPISIDEPMYHGIGLGEAIKCYQKNRMCKDVDSCDMHRKGWAKCNNKEK